MRPGEGDVLFTGQSPWCQSNQSICILSTWRRHCLTKKKRKTTRNKQTKNDYYRKSLFGHCSNHSEDLVTMLAVSLFQIFMHRLPLWWLQDIVCAFLQLMWFCWLYHVVAYSSHWSSLDTKRY